MNDETMAAGLVNSALIQSLIQTLVKRGVLSSDEATDVLENALLSLEEMQATKPHLQSVFDVAREMIEVGLKPRR